MDLWIRALTSATRIALGVPRLLIEWPLLYPWVESSTRLNVFSMERLLAKGSSSSVIPLNRNQPQTGIPHSRPQPKNMSPKDTAGCKSWYLPLKAVNTRIVLNNSEQCRLGRVVKALQWGCSGKPQEFESPSLQLFNIRWNHNQHDIFQIYDLV